MATVAAPNKLHPSQINLPENIRASVIERLNQTLATTLDMESHVKQAHWNVKGKDFFQLHELFDNIAMSIHPFLDIIGERIAALGGTALGTVHMAAQYSVLTEYPHTISKGEEHLQALIKDMAHYTKHLREDIDQAARLGDLGTADMYTQFSREMDQKLWFLEAHLQNNR